MHGLPHAMAEKSLQASHHSSLSRSRQGKAFGPAAPPPACTPYAGPSHYLRLPTVDV
jgi:hypothetical protein